MIAFVNEVLLEFTFSFVLTIKLQTTQCTLNNAGIIDELKENLIIKY